MPRLTHRAIYWQLHAAMFYRLSRRYRDAGDNEAAVIYQKWGAEFSQIARVMMGIEEAPDDVWIV